MTKLAIIITIILTVFGLAILSLVCMLYKPPDWLICWVQKRYPTVLFHVPTTKKIVALTIDDGPSSHTRGIQRLLKAHGVTATFFLIGSHIPGREDLLRELLRDGHELANHAMFDEMSVRVPAAELTRQIETVERQIAEIYATTSATADADAGAPAVTQQQKQPRYFRPGSGFFTTKMLALLAQPHLNHRLILGSVYPWDAQIPWPRLNAWHILSSLTPGATIVVHDRAWTAPMLRIVLPEMTRRGWRVGTVTDLLGPSINGG
ncbi:hypothetical protein AYO21_04731 [Fonsecaea monophora]|uniref:chitin deacetylase n=1 Tax=Fonsecaea monophora TaxID=254056 RepID=A0A177FAE9_9EURO|nr:hypothetical protein AYO21_04731 [Fonsecaea monophora]KAH0839138.1 hypothetical protein FOPE_05576 [Fonsecaea pedrosoi]OAG41118.1 hypothetical protein AYO21_04731 [Fonsecaea monophora]